MNAANTEILESVFSTVNGIGFPFPGRLADVKRAVKSATKSKFKTKTHKCCIEVVFEREEAYMNANGRLVCPENPREAILSKYHWTYN